MLEHGFPPPMHVGAHHGNPGGSAFAPASVRDFGQSRAAPGHSAESGQVPHGYWTPGQAPGVAPPGSWTSPVLGSLTTRPADAHAWTMPPVGPASSLPFADEHARACR